MSVWIVEILNAYKMYVWLLFLLLLSEKIAMYENNVGWVKGITKRNLNVDLYLNFETFLKPLQHKMCIMFKLTSVDLGFWFWLNSTQVGKWKGGSERR